MPFGVLNQPFTIINDRYRIKISKGTRVGFSGSDTPTIDFQGKDVRLMRIDGLWYADVYGCLMLVNINIEKPPYPISYFA